MFMGLLVFFGWDRGHRSQMCIFLKTGDASFEGFVVNGLRFEATETHVKNLKKHEWSLTTFHDDSLMTLVLSRLCWHSVWHPLTFAILCQIFSIKILIKPSKLISMAIAIKVQSWNNLFQHNLDGIKLGNRFQLSKQLWNEMLGNY